MTRLVLQKFDATQSSPFTPNFPPIIEFCARDDQGAHIFPARDAFFTAAKKARHEMDHPQFTTLDDYLGQFFRDGSHASQQLLTFGAIIENRLVQAGALEQDEKKPVVEIVAPRKAVFDGNIGAIMLAETVADRLNTMVPSIDWGVCYDVVYQAPLTDTNTPPLPRKHPGYAKQSQYMALEHFRHPDRTPFLAGIDDSSRYGRAARDLGLFAEQNDKVLLGFAVFQSYISTALNPEITTRHCFEQMYSKDDQQKLNTALKPFGLSINTLTDPEMQFFASDPLLKSPSGKRIDAAVDYLEQQAADMRCPVLLPRNDKFFRHIEEGNTLRFARIPEQSRQSIIETTAPKPALIQARRR